MLEGVSILIGVTPGGYGGRPRSKAQRIPGDDCQTVELVLFESHCDTVPVKLFSRFTFSLQ